MCGSLENQTAKPSFGKPVNKADLWDKQGLLSNPSLLEIEFSWNSSYFWCASLGNDSSWGADTEKRTNKTSCGTAEELNYFSCHSSLLRC